MSKKDEVWDLVKEAILRTLRKPFSNFVTKILLFSGAAVFVSPAIEHLIFSAILRSWFGIDIGVEVPGVSAYIFGSLLMLIGAGHNIVFVYLNSTHTINEKKLKESVYKELWIRLDDLLDDVARLVNLYCTNADPRDKEMVKKAEESHIEYLDFLRKNRPFFFSEEFYKDAVSLATDSSLEIEAFWACLDDKSNPNTNYQAHKAQKEAIRQINIIKKKYESLCQKIRSINIAI